MTILATQFLSLPPLFTSTAFLPGNLLPGWVRVVSLVTPVTYGVDIVRCGPDQLPSGEGTVMFADFSLEGQCFAAMDSAREHGFDFNEAISFVVDCADQEQVDYFWDELTADGGGEGQCGWLEDKYGVSWQIAPSVLPELLGDEDAERPRRVTEAMLRMEKIDVAALKAAYSVS